MKPSLLVVLAVFGLAACASPPTLYQPATGPGGLGYAESPIEHDRWWVSFHAAPGDSVERVTDLALQRAAQLTLDKGYDWFAVTARDVEGGRGEGIYADLGEPSHMAVTVTLEVVMARGAPPPEPETYDARQVRRRLGAPV